MHQKTIVIEGYTFICFPGTGRKVVASMRPKDPEELGIINRLYEDYVRKKWGQSPHILPGQWQWCENPKCCKAFRVSPSNRKEVGGKKHGIFCSKPCRGKMSEKRLSDQEIIQAITELNKFYGKVNPSLLKKERWLIYDFFAKQTKRGEVKNIAEAIRKTQVAAEIDKFSDGFLNSDILKGPAKWLVDTALYRKPEDLERLRLLLEKEPTAEKIRKIREDIYFYAFPLARKILENFESEEGKKTKPSRKYRQ